MRPGLLSFVTFATLAIGPALAQSPVKLRGNGPGNMHAHLDWLSMPSVQEELKLTPDQAARARAIARNLREEWTRKEKEMAGLPLNELARNSSELAANQYAEGMNALLDFLKPEQVDRYDQILFQRRKVGAMLEPDVAKALGLTEDQKRRIAEIAREGRDRFALTMRLNQGNTNAIRELELEITRESLGRAVENLTADQKKTWETLMGRPFAPKVDERVTR
jgi:hypothetical protein